MSDSSHSPDFSQEKEALVDALLTESGSSGQNDSAFLDSIELALDHTDAIPLPAQPRRNLTPMLWSSGIAAGIAIGAFAGLSIVSMKPKPVPFTVAKVENTVAWPSVIGCGPDMPTMELKREGPTTPLSIGAPVIDPSIAKPLAITPLETRNDSNLEASRTPEKPTSIASSYVIKLQERVKKADEAALRGSQLMADGDYQGSSDQYRASLDLLPDAPMTGPRRRAYVKQFSRACVLLGRNRADEGRYPEAIALVEEVLQPSVDPENIDARRLLEQLNDPDYYTSPALHPSHLERIRRVKLALKTAKGYVDLGDYDRADREYHKALNDDPYNIAARRGSPYLGRHRMDYYDAAYDSTRAKMLRQVAAGWEMPVPNSLPVDEKPSSNAWGQPPKETPATLASNETIGGEITAGYMTDYIFHGDPAKNGKTKDHVIRRQLPTASYADSSVAPNSQSSEQPVAGTIQFGANASQIDDLQSFLEVTSANFELRALGPTILTEQEPNISFLHSGSELIPAIENSMDAKLSRLESYLSQSLLHTERDPDMRLDEEGQKFRLSLRTGNVRKDVSITITEPWFIGNTISRNVENYYNPAFLDPHENYTFNDLLYRKLPNDTFDAAPPIKLAPPAPPASTSESKYSPLIDNPWASPLAEPLSTFSTDVDTASWTNLRAMIQRGVSAEAIPNDAVRIEEMINYFEWDYPQPNGEHPFAFAVETAPCPWNQDHQLMRIGIQGKEIPRIERPAANLVFLLDVSGSMGQPNKLPLVKKAIEILVEELNENDKVTLVVYAGAEGVALPPTSGRDQKTILEALGNLESGGSTNGGAGIKLAYSLAKDHFVADGINRVILCTDGDFNVGLTGKEDLVSLVEEKAKAGTYLSVMGFGRDNLNDAMLEEITNRGNGNYFHIDSKEEARKVFLNDLMGTLVTIAKDVKIQVEFNPAKVAKYRLIGYANRKLEAEDFANDEVDAGEVGSGHTVTALYEVIPEKALPAEPTLRYQQNMEVEPKKALVPSEELALLKLLPAKPTLRYQQNTEPEPKKALVPSEELALLKLRYKKPDSEHSILMTHAVIPEKVPHEASSDFQFASAVALFGMKLRDRKEVSHFSWEKLIELSESAIGTDARGYRADFIDLLRTLKSNNGGF